MKVDGVLEMWSLLGPEDVPLQKRDFEIEEIIGCSMSKNMKALLIITLDQWMVNKRK